MKNKSPASVLRVFDISTNARSTISQYDPHVGVSGEMSIGRISFVIESVFLVLLAGDFQAEHFVGEVKRFGYIFAGVDQFGFNINGFVYNCGVIETTALRLVPYALIAGQ